MPDRRMIAAEHITPGMKIVLSDSTTAEVEVSELRAGDATRWFIAIYGAVSRVVLPLALTPCYARDPGVEDMEPLRSALIQVVVP